MTLFKLNLTIAIPVLNEEKNLRKCLDAIGQSFADNIVLIDSGSTDNTLSIAQEYSIKVINFTWDGHFPKKRNWYLRNHTPTTKWVLFLDADEFLTDEFKKELSQTLKSTEYSGYWLTYTRYFLGKKLIGGYPLKKLALFKVGMGEYEYIEEDNWSKLDMEIHEHPVIDGKIGIIKAEIEHQDFRGISHYVLKHNEYALWEAERYLKLHQNEEIKRVWTWKQKIKYRLMNSPFLGISYFFGSYIFMGGFRDGSTGLVFAILKMSYFSQVYCKLKEKIA